MIYDQILTDERTVETPLKAEDGKESCNCGFCDSSLRLSARHVPTTNLLLVSKPFKAEYESRVAKAATLVVQDYVLSDFPEDFKPCFRGVNPSMPNLHLDLTLECPHDLAEENVCDVLVEMDMHRSWIDHLIPHLTNLRSITMNVRLHSQNQDLGCSQVLARHLSTFTTMDKLKALDVYFTDYGCGVDAWDYSTRGLHTMTWASDSNQLRTILPPVTGTSTAVSQP